jgi:serralysin
MVTNIPNPSLTEFIDAPASIETGYVLDVGQTAQGILSDVSDQDWYGVNLIAGQAYTFAAIGTGSAPLQDTYLYLKNSAGVDIISNDDGGPDRSSIIVYAAPTTGIYYLDVTNNWSVSRQYEAAKYGLSFSADSKPNFDFSMGAGAIVSYSSWHIDAEPTVVTYGFRDRSSSPVHSQSYIASFSRLSAAQISAVNLALTQWSDVANIQFEQVNVGGYTNSATMLFANYADASDWAGAYANYPGSFTFSNSAGDVWLNTAGGISTIAADIGSYTYETILHEIGHAIGLSHPGDYNFIDSTTFSYESSAQFLQDSKQYSVMSYFDAINTGSSAPNYQITTPLMFDILALQNIYGANLTTRVDETVYGFNSSAGTTYDFSRNAIPQFCIWDAGGVDTLDCSGFSQAQKINLAAGSFSDIGGYEKNISIALGVDIEKAIGGSGADQIFANALDNLLTGKAGNDHIDGGDGIDTAIYTGKYTEYGGTIASRTIIDLVANRDGTDTLAHIERLQFTDTMLALDTQANENAGNSYLLYQAAFDRTPDVEGLGYWISKMDQGANIVTDVAQNFILSNEFKSLYGANPTVPEFMNLLYQNVLNRAPDQEGLNYWLDEFALAGDSTLYRAGLLNNFAISAENIANVASQIADGIQYQAYVG